MSDGKLTIEELYKFIRSRLPKGISTELKNTADDSFVRIVSKEYGLLGIYFPEKFNLTEVKQFLKEIAYNYENCVGEKLEREKSVITRMRSSCW